MSTSLRYNRQKLIENWDQLRLSRSKVSIIGAGALGNHVAAGLIGLGIGKIEIYDYDVIEIHNLNRQSLFIESDVGMNKAEILAKRLKERNSEIRVIGFKDKIEESNISTIIGSPDLIIDAVDNVKTRSIISRYSLIKAIPLIHGAISADGGQVGTITRETPCIECFMNTERIDTDSQSCTNKPEPSVIYSAQIIAGIMIENARIMLSPLNNHESPIPPLLYYDTNNPNRFYKIKLNKKKNCICEEIISGGSDNPD